MGVTEEHIHCADGLSVNFEVVIRKNSSNLLSILMSGVILGICIGFI